METNDNKNGLPARQSNVDQENTNDSISISLYQEYQEKARLMEWFFDVVDAHKRIESLSCALLNHRSGAKIVGCGNPSFQLQNGFVVIAKELDVDVQEEWDVFPDEYVRLSFDCDGVCVSQLVDIREEI